MWHMEEELQKEGVSVSLLKEIQKFRESHVVDASVAGRVPVPRFLYYGKEIWEEAAAALLCGENLLLSGPKATGKTYWRKIWRQHSADHLGIFLFM